MTKKTTVIFFFIFNYIKPLYIRFTILFSDNFEVKTEPDNMHLYQKSGKVLSLPRAAQIVNKTISGMINKTIAV